MAIIVDLKQDIHSINKATKMLETNAEFNERFSKIIQFHNDAKQLSETQLYFMLKIEIIF